MVFKAAGMRGGAPGAEQGGSREPGALALSALALALLAVVGLASSGSPWQTSRAAASAPTSALQALAAAAGVVLVVSVLLLWVGTPAARRSKKGRRTRAGAELDEVGASAWTTGRAVAVFLLGLAVFCIAALPLLSRSSASPQRGTDARPSAPAGPPPSEVGRPADSLDLGWLLFPIAVTLAILTPAAVVIRRRRLRQGDATETGATGALGAVRASIAALETERDPRTAILRAYARMERAFRDVEVVRARDETASEFLGRTMGRLPASAGDAAVLTERFEEVRFSTHQVTEADREQALASLHRVERELTERP